MALITVESSIPAPSPSRPAEIVVRTTYGPVEGEQAGRLQVFRGISYAAPPLGRLRWRPPVPPTPWAEVRPAHEFGPACPQVAEPGSTESLPPMSEDCLTVNVWTPRADSGSRPVMVFIHGGAFMEGSAREESYDGTSLAERGSLVVISLQYRIGILGFLELAEIGGKDFAESGNLGILDQIAALRWVRQNVAAFGGDPRNVTVFGESAGGVSAGTLLAAVQARGLFQKAIIESPRAPYAHTKARATRIARQVMKLAGATTVREFEALSTDELLAAQKKVFDARFEDTCYYPVLDGITITEPPQRAILQGRGADVPLLIGTNLEELNLWMYEEGLPLDKIPLDVLQKHFASFLGPRASAVIDRYTKGHSDQTAGQGIVFLLGDLTFRIPAIRVAEATSTRRPTWMYLFAYRGGKYGAEHAAELPFVFGLPNQLGPGGTEKERRMLMDQIQQSWISFALTANPNHPGLPTWPKYNAKDRATMEFDIPSRVVNDPYPDERSAWASVPFDGITPDIDQASGAMTLGGGGKYWRW